jgi:uncharacterized protein (TIGR00303 family)
MNNSIKIYSEIERGRDWVDRYRGKKPIFACILGFTETGSIEGISAAGATPEARRYTAVADAEYLINGATKNPVYPLPPLAAGVSPILISRAVTETFNLPIYLFNAGLPLFPSVPSVDLGGIPAQCLTTGKALPLRMVTHLWQQGRIWGAKLARDAKDKDSYVIISECVVGGTTTASAVLTALGIDAAGKINSSHPQCNHRQKQEIVAAGLSELARLKANPSPLEIVAAVGDPMQIVAAAMATRVSKSAGVLLAGGTQMLTVYALMLAIGTYLGDRPCLDNIVVGTTRWVAEDPTGDTVGLVRNIKPIVPLLATQLDFSSSKFASLRAYEEGFVKEGAGAGGCAIASYLLAQWSSIELAAAVEKLVTELELSRT